jgi:hypothetical protein
MGECSPRKFLKFGYEMAFAAIFCKGICSILRAHFVRNFRFSKH